MAHPRSNGQAERANAEVLRGLQTRTFKKKLEACGRGWHDELQSVLWSIHTTATKPTGETPFFLVYGAEAVLPHEVKHHSARVLAFDETQQDAMRGMDLMLGRNIAVKLQYGRQDTSRRCGGITIASAPGRSRWMTSS